MLQKEKLNTNFTKKLTKFRESIIVLREEQGVKNEKITFRSFISIICKCK